jgi:hypothetical protein
MKITKTKLRQIIQEELAKLDEGLWDMIQQTARGGSKSFRGWQKGRKETPSGTPDSTGRWPAGPTTAGGPAAQQTQKDPSKPAPDPDPDPDLTQMLYDLGQPEDIAKVLKYTMEDVPEAKTRFKHYYDKLMS